ncbi:unnamed protein product [Orchesella dallaii]|uniref:Uncharacterized protein n=1 Tax=Orchesella dallaii TaxID=48710 RepID=A0ABP1QH79_9HEXA
MAPNYINFICWLQVFILIIQIHQISSSASVRAPECESGPRASAPESGYDYSSSESICKQYQDGKLVFQYMRNDACQMQDYQNLNCCGGHCRCCNRYEECPETGDAICRYPSTPASTSVGTDDDQEEEEE